MKKVRFLALCLSIILLFSGCELLSELPVGSDFETVGYSTYEGLCIKFIDVGQGDCELIMLPDKKTLLIDGGDVGTEDEVVDYLKAEGIEKIDYMLATHPHADHIGGLDDLLNNFEVGTFIMPYIPESDVPTTKVYEKLIDAVLNNGCEVEMAKAGAEICKGDDYSATCLSPVNENNDGLNNYSAVVRLEYKDTAYIFTGDAEQQAEEDILNSGAELSADVIKVGHHGSYTATTLNFLNAVNPEYAVISVGEDNKYGHPHSVTINKLQQRCEVFRTDKSGTVTLVSDGKSIEFSYEKSIYS